MSSLPKLNLTPYVLEFEWNVNEERTFRITFEGAPDLTTDVWTGTYTETGGTVYNPTVDVASLGASGVALVTMPDVVAAGEGTFVVTRQVLGAGLPYEVVKGQAQVKAQG